MICPAIKTVTEYKEFLDSDGTYIITTTEKFGDCQAGLCPCYLEHDNKQYCSKFRFELVGQ